MALEDFLKEIDDEVSIVNSSDFEVEIIETNFVPSFSDPNITYDNLDTQKTKCKRLESCVLYVDIRGSARISAERKPKTLAKIYSSFVRSMISCARYYGGHVRNIVGDRVMVVFDKEGCYTNAVNTAILMNTVCQHILNKRIKAFEFKAGVGIDYGKMLITKAGVVRQGDEKEFYRGLVWLGRPANIASRLTDLAHKTVTTTNRGIKEGLYYPNTDVWHWSDVSFEDFIGRLEPTFSRNLRHENEYFSSFIYTSLPPCTVSYSPILMTKAVFDGYKAANPERDSIKKGWFAKRKVEVKDYDGDVYGGAVYKTAVNNI